MTAPDLFGGVSVVEVEPPAPAAAAPLVVDQPALFDLAGLTRKIPGQEQREALDAAGVTPSSRKLAYEEASIRQIVTYWQQDHYLEILKKLEAAGRLLGTDNHTDTVERILEHFLGCGLVAA